MSAYDILQSVLNEGLKRKKYKQVSPIMYDMELLNKKVSVLIFEEDENKNLVRKFKYVVEEFYIAGDLTARYEQYIEALPLVHKYAA